MISLDHTQGLLGYYFTDDAGKDLVLMREEKGALLAQKKTKDIKFIRWVGDIQPEETGNYTFSSSDNTHVALQIDNKLVLMSKKSEAIPLEKDTTYRVRLEYKASQQLLYNEMPPLQLSWSYNGQSFTPIPDTCLFHPDFSGNKRYGHASSYTLFEGEKAGEYYKVEKNHPDEDRDGDGIYDDWEKDGWTLDGDKDKRSWKNLSSELSPEDLKKYNRYVTNPYLKYTTGDPYTDLQHPTPSNQKSLGTSSEVSHPLVAAFPSLRLTVKEIIISTNNDVTKGSNVSDREANSTATTQSKTTNWNIGGSRNVGMSMTGPSIGLGLSGGYGQSTTNSTTTSYDKSHETTNSSSETVHNAQAAYIGFAVEIENIGTAPIIEAQAQFNVYLASKNGNDKRAICTFVTRENNKILTLNPGQAKNTTITTNDDFGSHSQALNAEQLKCVLAGEELIIELTGIKGLYGNLPSKELALTHISDTEAATARLTLITPEGKIYDRRVACQSSDIQDPKNFTPPICLYDAVRIAFGGTEDHNGHLNCKEFTLDENATFIFDNKGEEKLHAISEKQNAGHKVMLEPGMGIIIQPKEFQEPLSKEYHIECEGVGRLNTISYRVDPKITKLFEVKTHRTYVYVNNTLDKTAEVKFTYDKVFGGAQIDVTLTDNLKSGEAKISLYYQEFPIASKKLLNEYITYVHIPN